VLTIYRDEGGAVGTSNDPDVLVQIWIDLLDPTPDERGS
jgi:hypothetical protein